MFPVFDLSFPSLKYVFLILFCKSQHLCYNCLCCNCKGNMLCYQGCRWFTQIVLGDIFCIVCIVHKLYSVWFKEIMLPWYLKRIPWLNLVNIFDWILKTTRFQKDGKFHHRSISSSRPEESAQSLGSGYGNCWNTLANIGFMKIASAYTPKPELARHTAAARTLFNL